MTNVNDIQDLWDDEDLPIANSNDSTENQNHEQPEQVETEVDPLGYLGNLLSIQEVTFDTGEKKPFESLSAEEKLILIEEQIRMLSQANQAEEEPEVYTANEIENLTAEEIFILDLKNENPEITDEELQSELELAKTSKLFEAKMAKLKQEYIESYISEEQASLIEEHEKMADLYLEQIAPLQEIDGILISDKDKNELLEDLLTIESNNVSRFFNELMTDPVLAFKANMYLKHGTTIIENLGYSFAEQLDAQKKEYEKQIEEAYQRGRNEILRQTNNSARHTFIKPSQQDNSKVRDVNSLWED